MLMVLFDVTRVGQFIRLNLLTFTRSKVEKDPQEFLSEMEKIFRLMRANDTKVVESVDYQLKRVSY